MYVYLDAGVDKGIDEVSHPDTNALISRLEDEVRFLREELARKDAILLNMTENIRQLTASEAPEPRERPETASEGEGGGAAREEAQGATERPWWRRMFGG